MSSTITRAQITEFLSHKKLALIRASRATKVRGVKIDDELKTKGYTVSVIYLDESAPGARLKDLKNPVEGVIIAVPPAQAAKAIQEAIEAKMPRIWLQQGAESPEALEACKAKQIPVIYNACVMMYAEPVQSFHSFHKWLWKTFGLLAK